MAFSRTSSGTGMNQACCHGDEGVWVFGDCCALTVDQSLLSSISFDVERNNPRHMSQATSDILKVFPKETKCSLILCLADMHSIHVCVVEPFLI